MVYSRLKHYICVDYINININLTLYKIIVECKNHENLL